MKRILWLVVILLLAGCAPPTTTAPSGAEESPLAPMPTEFIPVEVMADANPCKACHTGLTDGTGRDVSFDILWQPGMMANAARDPYWQATVDSEVAMLPELREVIEDKCATCHMPMARFDAFVNQKPTGIVGDGFLNPDNDLHALAMDGVSCNLCHQIEADGFGEVESFSGHYVISDTLPWGERMSYGPFPVGPGMVSMMAVSGFVPVQSDHITDSALCATCHVLFTPYVDAEGNVAGEFPEQAVYLEWENSGLTDTSCQDCHMPRVEGPVKISSISGNEKSYLREHTFTGANAFMLSIFKANAEAIGITATPEALDAQLARVTKLLQKNSGNLIFTDLRVKEGELNAKVVVENLAGHKFPSGYPSRRAWLHVTVTDGSGAVVFESGAYQPDGLIVGNDNDADPALYEPHYSVITEAGQVQIYEAILGNTDGDVTTTLLRASGYLKDNRLLPAGFVLDGIDPAIAPYGAAAADENFIGGSDVIRYVIDVSDYEGPFIFHIELLYQSIGYRWAENLGSHGTTLTDTFMAYYASVDNIPVVVAVAERMAVE